MRSIFAKINTKVKYLVGVHIPKLDEFEENFFSSPPYIFYTPLRYEYTLARYRGL
jgi:hypothetical protein